MDIESLKNALAASPENIPLNLLLAEAYKADLSFDKAKTLYLIVLSMEPSNKDAQLKLAEILDLEGSLSEAIVRVESICQNHTEYAEAWVLRARLNCKDGNISEARGFYKKGLELNPSLKDTALEREIGEVQSDKEKVPTTAQEWLPEEIFDEEDAGESFDAISGASFLSEVEFEEKVNIDFSNVGGMEDVKEDIRMKIIHPLNNKELFEAYGKKPGGGVLLYGPPGCGKTLISKATAGEIQSSFYSIGLHQILDMWLGQSEDKLHQVFEMARRNAPSVIFFDEIDALAADRKDLKGSAGRTLINQFLAELDGTQAQNDGVLILGATNAPWHLDSAFLRPGRFDRIVFVPPPDEVARKSILEIMAKDKPLDKVDFQTLAKKTKGFSGADLEGVFTLATERTLDEAMKKGKVIPVTEKMLLKARKEVKPSTLRWFESAKNYAMYANQSGLYDDINKYLGIQKP